MIKSKFKFLAKSEDNFRYVSSLLRNVSKKDTFLVEKLDECQYNIIKYICAYNMWDNPNMKKFYVSAVIEEYALYDYLINKLYDKRHINEKQYLIIGNNITEIIKIAKGIIKSNNKKEGLNEK